ncbi:MAG: nuclear transport factor 2 family protein [Bryobacteraceae bacterium]
MSGQSTSTKSLHAERRETHGLLAQEVLAIKHQYDEAQLENDSDWFQRMFADDYIFVLPDSTVVTKAEFIKDLESRDLVWESVSGRDMRVRVYGNTAVVTGQFFGKGRYKRTALDERQLFTSVWIKRDGRWQAISETCHESCSGAKIVLLFSPKDRVSCGQSPRGG